MQHPAEHQDGECLSKPAGDAIGAGEDIPAPLAHRPPDLGFQEDLWDARNPERGFRPLKDQAVFPQHPAVDQRIVVGGALKVEAAVVEIPERLIGLVQIGKDCLRKIGPFQMPGPVMLQSEHTGMDGLEVIQQQGVQVVLDHDHEIDITVGIPAPMCERPGEIAAQELGAQHRANPIDQLVQYAI